jgi:hypothetical protein
MMLTLRPSTDFMVRFIRVVLSARSSFSEASAWHKSVMFIALISRLVLLKPILHCLRV